MASRPNLWLGLICILAALLVGLLWIPLDTGTGIVERVRRQVVIGDALAPAVAAIIVAIGGLSLCLVERKSRDQAALTRRHLAFLAASTAVLAAGLFLMRWTGPAVVSMFDGRPDGLDAYRPLRDTAPWKYIGYMVGGTVLIAAPIVLTERRLSLKAVAIACLATAALVLIYDFPFEDLLLPPNGDV